MKNPLNGAASGAVWRLIPWFSASGRVQMAIDAYLLEQHCQGQHPPTLRFYGWNPPAISLGYHQRTAPDYWQHLVYNGVPIELVRRPTGGRAVLHQGDLTYAVITSGIAGNRVQAYQSLCEFLIQGWRTIGVPLHYGQAGRGYIHNPNCFGTATGADLVMATGAKLIGSAQIWRSGAVLQHGSMQLQPDPALFQQVFGSVPLLPDLLPDLADELRGDQGRDRIISALVQAAQQQFQIDFQIQLLTDAEWVAISALADPVGS